MYSGQTKMRISDFLKGLGISLLWITAQTDRVWRSKWPENSCVRLDPQLLLCPDIFISVAYLCQQCMRKGSSWPKWQTDYMAPWLYGLLLILTVKQFWGISMPTHDVILKISDVSHTHYNAEWQMALFLSGACPSQPISCILAHKCSLYVLYW